MKIYVVPSQHWDPFWTIEAKVSERMGVNNLRKALDIINENPDFRYTLDQVYLWELFRKYFPQRIEELRKRVREGKIELTCGGYVNPDLNLPSGESLIRQIVFGKRVWGEEFGITPKVAGIMDSFGQSGQLPQIFLKSGLKYHTSKRGASRELPACFVWEGVDGSRILFDRQPLGHHGIVLFPFFSFLPKRERPWEKLEKVLKPFSPILAAIALLLPDFYIWASTKGRVCSFREALSRLVKLYPTDKILILHGFGADGAMPFAWILYLSKFYSRFSRNKMVVSSPSQFFEDLEKDKDRLIVVRGELNGPTEKRGEAFGVLPGTYSGRMGVKELARENERLLYLVELLEGLKFLALGRQEQEEVTSLWKLKFLTDFHDGICGCLNETNFKILKGKALLIREGCQKLIRNSLELLSPKMGVLNPLPWLRKDIVELGKEWRLVEALPMGIGPIKVLEPEGKFKFNPEQKTLITPFYRVSWADEGLEIYENSTKITGEKFARIRLQNEGGDAYFFDVSGEEWDEIDSLELAELTPLRATLEIKSHLRKIKITQLIHFYLHTKRVDFVAKIDNQEKNVRIQVHLAFNIPTEGLEVTREIPAGFLKEGSSSGQTKWKDVFGERYGYYDQIKCVQNWIYFGSEEEGLAVFNKELPEHEIKNGSTGSPQGCFITLLRCVGRLGTTGKGLKKFSPANVPWRAGSPFPTPLAQEQGEHEFRYAVYPSKRGGVARECYEFLFPLIFCQGKNTRENLSLLSISEKGVIPLAIKKAERKNGVVLRLLETEGRKRDIEIRLNPAFNFRGAQLTNLMEEKIADLAVDNNTIKLPIKPQEIVTLILENRKD